MGRKSISDGMDMLKDRKSISVCVRIRPLIVQVLRGGEGARDAEKFHRWTAERGFLRFVFAPGLSASGPSRPFDQPFVLPRYASQVLGALRIDLRESHRRVHARGASPAVCTRYDAFAEAVGAV